MKIVILVFSLFISSNTLIAQSGITGKISDADTGEEFIGANVVLSKDGVFITRTSTDFDGNYNLSVNIGVYDMEVTYIGYKTKRIEKVEVKAEEIIKMDVLFTHKDEGLILAPLCSYYYHIPLFEQDNLTSGKSISVDNIRTLSQKSIPQLAGLSSSGVSILDQ